MRAEMLPWAEDIRHLLYHNGFGLAWEDHNGIEPKIFGKILLNRLNEQYM